MSVVILGIDPGLANTGWGVIESSQASHRCVAYGCISTDSSEPLPARLARIHAEIADVIERYSPTACAVESVFFGANAKSAFATGQARGVALLALAEAQLELGEYSPVQIKGTVVGTGSAEKSQVSFMVRTILDLPHEPRPDHAADALAAAICHSHQCGSPTLRAQMAEASR